MPAGADNIAMAIVEELLELEDTPSGVVDCAPVAKNTQSDHDQIAEALAIPLWGRTLIKGLWWAGGLIFSAFLAVGWQLYSLNRDVGRIDGKVGEIPAAIAEKMMDESKANVDRGDTAEAARDLVLATSFLTDAKKKKAPVNADFFDDAYAKLNQLAKVPQLSNQWQNARLELASYRSVLQSPPKLAEPGKRVNAPISRDELNDATYLVMESPGEFFVPPSVVRKLSDSFGVENIVLVGGVDGVTQTLDGIRWINDVFENVQIRYRSGEVLLDNVKFVNCTFDITNDPGGVRVTDYAIVGEPEKLVIGQENAGLSNDHTSLDIAAAIAGATRKLE
jgi:hypothetical protein